MIQPANAYVRLVGFDSFGREVFNAPKAQVKLDHNVDYDEPWSPYPPQIRSERYTLTAELRMDQDAGYAVRQFRYPEGPPVPKKKLHTFAVYLAPFETVEVKGHKAYIDLVADREQPILKIQKDGKNVAIFTQFVGYATV